MSAPSPRPAAMAVSDDERRFYIDLGRRIATLRKECGLTQVQLAERLGVAQQTLAHYEAGRLRLLAGALPPLAEHLGVGVEELIGAPATAKRNATKRGPQPKIAQQLQLIEALPKTKQRAISQVLDSVIAAHQ